MGSRHSQLVGDELHIARTFVSTGDPNGVVTPGIIGEFYWDSDANLLYVAESLLNTSWATATGSLGSFLGLTDTPGDYTGQAGNVVQVNGVPDGLEFGQNLTLLGSPSFNALTIQPVSGNANFFLNDSGSVLKGQLLYNSTSDAINLDALFIDLDLSAVGGGSLNINSNLGEVTIFSGSAFHVNTNLLFVDISTGFVGIGSATPLAQLFVSSPSADIVPVSMQESLGTNGARITTLVGTQDPEGNVTGSPGDHYWRVSGVNSTLFIKRSAGSSTAGWDTVFDGTASGNVSTVATLTDNFLVRGNSLETIDIGNIFMSADGNALTIPGALDLIPPEPVIVSTLQDNVQLNGADHITVVNNFAYIANSIGNSLTIVDITDPNALFIVGTLVDAANFPSATSVHVSGKYAFVTSNTTDSLNIIDITNVSAPVLVGRVVDSVAMDSPDDAFVASKFCYVIGQTSDSLAVIDISDPEAPFVAGSLIDAFNLTDPRALYVYGKFAYVTLLTGTLKIIDISDPTAPVIVGTFINANMNASNQVYVVGRYAYVTSDFSDSFTIIDISDPTAPVLAGQIVDSINFDRPSSLSIDGNFAYVGTFGNPSSIIVVDISDRTAPAIIQTLSTGTTSIGDIFVSGKFAYIVVSGQDSISAVDLGGIDVSIANIGNISAGYISVDNDVHIKGLLTTSGLDVGVHGIHSDGGISASGELKIVPSAPMLLGSLTDANLDGADHVTVVNNYAYVTSESTNSLTILDITDPGSPFIVSNLSDGINFPFPTSVFVSGKYAYITSTSANSISIVDVSDVSAPVFVSSLIDAVAMGGPQQSFVVGKFCYVVGFQTDSLAIVDISDPNDPVLAGSLIDGTNFVSPRHLYVLGKFVYAVMNGAKLKIVDISDPTTPVIVGTLTNTGLLSVPRAIYVVGRYAYITSFSQNSFVIVDVSDPTSPTIVGSVVDAVLLDEPADISIDGNYAYVATGGISESIVVIDISNKTTPVITRSFPAGLGDLSHLFVSGKHAYVLSPAGVPAFTGVFSIIDLNGIDASTASIGNIKAGYLSVDNEIVAKGITYSGGFNAGPHGMHSDGDISGLTSFSTFPNGDTFPIERIKNTGSNPGVSQRFIGNRDPNGNVTGFGGDVYFRGAEGESGSYESRESVGGGTLWFKRSVNPPSIVEINDAAEFEALASGGIVTVSSDLTLVFNITVPTTTRFVLDFANLNITGVGGVNHTGGGTLFSGSGTLIISSGIKLTGDDSATLMTINGNLFLVDINKATISNFASLGSFTNGSFSLTFVKFVNCAAGFTLTNTTNIFVFKVGGLATATPTAFPMTTALFTLNTNNPLSVMSFSEIKSDVTSTGSVFDLDTTINFDVDLIDINHVAAEEVPANITAPIFKQSTVATVGITGVSDISPLTNGINSMADNGAGGTTIDFGLLADYEESQIVTISGTVAYNGTFQIFNLVGPGISFDIIQPFVTNEATGSIDSEVLALFIPFGSGVVLGDNIKVTGTKFYNAFYTVVAITGSLTGVNATFISDDTGTLEINLSLDETDVRVNAKDCVGIPNSVFLASGFVNSNTFAIAGVSFTNGIFRDALFGGVGTGLIASVSMAKWRMTDESNGTFELLVDVFDGWINFNYSLASDTTPDPFRFKFQIDKGAGFVDLPDAVEALVDVADEAVSISNTFPLQAVKGDLIKPQVERVAGANFLQFISASINARQSN